MAAGPVPSCLVAGGLSIGDDHWHSRADHAGNCGLGRRQPIALNDGARPSELSRIKKTGTMQGAGCYVVLPDGQAKRVAISTREMVVVAKLGFISA